MAVNNGLLIPWMKDRHRFVDPQFSRDSRNHDCLLKLGVKKLSTEVLLNDYVLPLPSTLSDAYWQHFKLLIGAISGTTFSANSSYTLLSTLKQSKLAADENRNLRKPCELYDHQDQIFVSAFRHQRETRFLHDSVKEYRLFWLRVGLRHRVDSFINPKDYIQCLQVMKLRLSAEDRRMDPHLEQDSRTVLSPLTAPNSNIQRFSAYDWLAISQESVFLSRTAFNAESEYRQNIMASVATKQRLLCLSEVISHDHVGICWSQTSFPIHQPTREVLGKVPGNGQPKIDIVWRHLEQMKDVAQRLKRYQIRDFLADLYLTYEYLQDHLQESMAGFNLKKSAVWLNLNTSDHNAVLLDDIKSSWHMIGELVLSSSFDAGPIKAVRPGLMRYEKLLRALGCSSIIYPTVTRPELHSGRTVSNSLRQLRREGKLIDIKYSTEGKTIYAHRVVLAAISEKCALQFSGRWKVDDVIEYDKDVDPEDFLSHHTLSTMINYAYEDEINWEEMEVLESDDADAKAVKLDLLLDVHKGADYWLIPALASQVEDKILIAGRAFINLENVIRIRERAEQVRAKAVERMCAEFIEQNRDTVEKVHFGIL
jgi:sacsin